METFYNFSNDGKTRMETHVFQNHGPYKIAVAVVESAEFEGVAFSAFGLIRVLGLPKDVLQTYKNKTSKQGTPAIISINGRPYFTSVFAMFLAYEAEQVEVFQWLDKMTVSGAGSCLEDEEIAFKICSKFGVSRAIPDFIEMELEENPEISI